MNFSLSKVFTKYKVAVAHTILLISFSTKVSAAEEAVSAITKSDPMSGSYLLQLIFGLIVVVFCIVALAWFSKKMNRFQSLADDSLQIIGGISVGTRERVVLLQVGEEQIVVGVSPGRLSTLHVLDKPIERLTDNTASAMGKGFSDKLKAMMADADKPSDTKKKKQ